MENLRFNSVCLVRWFWWNDAESLRFLRLGKPGIARITLEHLVDVIDEILKEQSERGWGGCALCCVEVRKRTSKTARSGKRYSN